MFWLAFLVHFHDPEIRLQLPSVLMGRKVIQWFRWEENGIVDICNSTGSYSFYSQAMPPPPPLPPLHTLGPPHPIPCCTGNQVRLFLTVDFWNCLVYQVESGCVEKIWWTWVYILGHEVPPSSFFIGRLKKCGTSNLLFSAVLVGRPKSPLMM